MLPTITDYGYALDAEVAYRREQLAVTASRHRLRRAITRLRSLRRTPTEGVPAPRSASDGPAGSSAPAGDTGDDHSLAA